MADLSVQVTVIVEGMKKAQRVLRLQVPATPTDKGLTSWLEELVAYLEVEVRFAEFDKDLPPTDDLRPTPSPLKFSLDDLFSGQRENLLNKRELWNLVGNTIFPIRLWLSKAKAFHDVQSRVDPANEQLQLNLFHEKMEKLRLAIHGIANLSELPLRIVSEALGHSRMETTHKGKKLIPRNLGELVRYRSKFESLRHLEDEQFDGLKEIADMLRHNYSSTVSQFWLFRNRLVHQEPPSVEDARLFPQLEGRAWKEYRSEKGVRRVKSFGGRRPAEWDFDSLYKMVVEAFDHYLSVLRQLKALSSFSP